VPVHHVTYQIRSDRPVVPEDVPQGAFVVAIHRFRAGAITLWLAGSGKSNTRRN